MFNFAGLDTGNNVKLLMMLEKQAFIGILKMIETMGESLVSLSRFGPIQPMEPV